MRGVSLTHGGSNTRLYYVWHTMRQRCSNPKVAKFADYGARGIRVCEEWQDFAAFRDWAQSAGYRQGLQIDREDNDGNYEPSNCRWVTAVVQRRNRRDTQSKQAISA